MSKGKRKFKGMDRETYFRERFLAAREREGKTLVLRSERVPQGKGFFLYAEEGSLGAERVLEAFKFQRIERTSKDDEFPRARYRRYVQHIGEARRLLEALAFALGDWRVVLGEGPFRLNFGPVIQQAA